MTYTISCQLSGGRSARSSLTVVWTLPAPVARFSEVQNDYIWTTRPFPLTWNSNVSPCSITGGSTTLTNLPASGATTVTQSTPGDVTYQLTCGSGNRVSHDSMIVNYVTPALQFAANGSDRIIGEQFYLIWNSRADSCAPSGGAPGDGWDVTTYPSSSQATPRVATPGTYTHSRSCSSGPVVVNGRVTVTFENNPPYVTASVDRASTALTDTPADHITLTWDSNLSICSVSTTPNLPGYMVGPITGAITPQGTMILTPMAQGSYTVSVSCTALLTNSISASSAPITLTVLPPPAPTASITISPSTVPNFQNFTVSWSSTNASGCEQTGSGPFVWGQGAALATTSGSQVLSATGTGTYTLGVSCASIDPLEQGPATASAQLTVAAAVVPSVTVTPHSTSVKVGQPVTLTWASSNVTKCAASGGGANGTPWTAAIGTSGSLTQTATTVGTFVYTVACQGEGLQADDQGQVVVAATSASGGGGGGGGSAGWLELAALALTVVARSARAPGTPCGAVRRRSPVGYRTTAYAATRH